VSAKRVALTLLRGVAMRRLLPADGLDEPPEVVFSCPRCAEREFGDESH
jgi:hypothetical protein